ncbi:MAG TPA: DUF3536 domain-containing protein [Gemmatimonadaceae bacterium]|nr:DUF3536 domain-containing protein [Gemmatimonadaceae bacterium]
MIADANERARSAPRSDSLTPSANQSVVIHGHFYQPPREDPWLDEIEAEASAAPYHDWNERIERECYRAVVAAHLKGPDTRIVGIVNTLEWISFNFGATLLAWLETQARGTYDAILEADRSSVRRLGFGNAIAQPYHHIILPLASRRDKRTEVLWGIADFKRRFGRDPLGMWLPETAVDSETLDVLAECGIKFTVLAPHQVETPPPNGLPGVYRAANGQTVALFLYDGDLSHGVAFGGLLHNAVQWAARMLRPVSRETAASRLASIATDGETYGHHHKFAEMALARVITDLNARSGVVVENFASFLARNPATDAVKLVEPTSWSCAHGVERWRSNCGCRVNGNEFPSQEWRTPLRGGLDVLAAGLNKQFELEGRQYFADPWEARDRYGEALSSPEPSQVIDSLLAPHSSLQEAVRAKELLEVQHDALRMYSSCAWFFDDIGGLEPRQVMRYAAHAIELAAAEDVDARRELEDALLAYLVKAKSNDADVGNGALVYESVRHPVGAEIRTTAAVAVAQTLGLDAAAAAPRSYDVAINGSTVQLHLLRTGRKTTFRAEASLADPVNVSARVSRDESANFELVHINDFPERARRLIRTKLRHQLMLETLTADELTAIANGDATLRDLASRALVRAILAIVTDGAAAFRRAHAVLDLLEQTETSVPFDAQTVFWRVRDSIAADSEQLASLGARLGFSLPPVAAPLST